MLADSEIRECISYICSEENIQIEEDAIKEVINLSDGCMRNAVNIVDETFSFSGTNIISKDNITKIFGIAEKDMCVKMTNYLFTGNAKDAVKLARELYQTGINLNSFSGMLYEYIFDKTTNDKKEYTKGTFFMKELGEFVTAFHTKTPRILDFEIRIMRMCNPEMWNGLEGLLERIKILENKQNTVIIEDKGCREKHEIFYLNKRIVTQSPKKIVLKG